MGAPIRKLALLLICAAAVPPAYAHTAQECDAFTRDLSREFAAMRSAARTPPSSASR